MENRTDSERIHSRTSSPEAARIRDALSELLGDPDRDATALREAVCAFVAMLRDLDLPPERTLVAVKEITNSVQASALDIDRHQEIMRSVTEWCVDVYYGKHRAD